MSHARRLVVAVLPALLLLAAVVASADAKTVWLCKPGLANDPCRPGLDTTRFAPAGARLGVDQLKRAKRPRFDCFYVYPTVSDQKTPQASLSIDPELRSIAFFQAARYSQDCRVYAPVYRQITLAGLSAPATVTPAMRASAYADVRNAWREYVKRYNKGRGVVLIGHSQGTFVLRQLVTREVDRKPAVRKRLISALLLGGNVTVKTGRDTGGDFHNIRACRSAKQVGCVVAFSTFGGPVPANALFGRTAEKGREILCTNPAALRGGAGRITPVYPTAPFAPGSTIGLAVSLVGQSAPQAETTWRAFPKSYEARCSSDGGADVLQITPVDGAKQLTPVPDATWGLHLTDANIALGDLVGLVRRQAASWQKRRG